MGAATAPMRVAVCGCGIFSVDWFKRDDGKPEQAWLGVFGTRREKKRNLKQLSRMGAV